MENSFAKAVDLWITHLAFLKEVPDGLVAIYPEDDPELMDCIQVIHKVAQSVNRTIGSSAKSRGRERLMAEIGGFLGDLKFDVRRIQNMIYFKSCPKCHGDMYQDKDFYGAFLTCLQCGLTNDLEITPQKSKHSSFPSTITYLGNLQTK